MQYGVISSEWLARSMLLQKRNISHKNVLSKYRPLWYTMWYTMISNHELN